MPAEKIEHKRILIVIPAFNEAGRIHLVLEQCRKYFSGNIDLLVVDDGSTDGTYSICVNEKNVMTVSVPFNHGVGNALKTGFRFAIEYGYDFIITLDADGQHDPDDLPKFFEPLLSGNYDLVIGSRFLNGKKYDGSFLRIAGNKFFAKIVSFLIREKLTDVTSGYRGMNRAALKFSVDDLFNFDYPDADFLLTLHRAGFRFCEIPVTMKKRIGGQSQHKGLGPVYYVLKMFLSIFIILLRKKKRVRKPE